MIGARNVEWFDVPLDDQECYWIAKSVCKISRQNLASGQTQRQFGSIQAVKGRRSGEARRRRTTERDAEIVARVEAGESMRSMAREFGLHHRAIQRIMERGG